MKKVKANQFKALSDFCNTVAAAWFTAGTVVPVINQSTDLTGTVILTGKSSLLALFFLMLSLYFAGRTKL